MELTGLKYQPNPISVAEVYNNFPIKIPEGMEAWHFRPVCNGDLFLSVVDVSRGERRYSVATPETKIEGPRLILRLKPDQTTPLGVYGPRPVVAPEGYELVEFRQLRAGDMFIPHGRNNEGFGDYKVGPITHTPAEGTFRWIVRAKPAPKKIVRVVRVLEYVGPEDWIDNTMKHNAVGPEGPRIIRGENRVYNWNLPEGKSIRQLSAFKEEVK